MAEVTDLEAMGVSMATYEGVRQYAAYKFNSLQKADLHLSRRV